MKNLPYIYSQRDTQWANQRLGTVDGTTIGGYGCYITSFSMVAGFYGHQITPAQFDDACTNKFYVDGNLATDDMLQKVFPDCQYIQSYSYQNDPADLNKLKDLMSDPNQIVILELDFDHNPNDGIQTHFVVCVDCDGTNISIADPWYGSVDAFTKNYGNNPSQTILSFVVYKGTVAENTISSDTQKTLDDLRIARDNNWNLYQTELSKNTDLTKQVGDLTEQNKNYQQDIQTLQRQVGDLADQVKKIKDEDISLSSETIDAQHQRDDMLILLQSHYKQVNATDEQSYEKAIQSLQAPHDQVVKQVQPTMEALADAAIYKKAPLPQPSIISKFLNFLFQRG